MSVVIENTGFLAQAAQKLQQREAELRALLQAAGGVPGDAYQAEVLDFKDVAAEESRVAVDEVAYAHASEELGQVLAARRRLEDGSYAQCEDCGEAIDQRRLLALPATRYCTACQAIHERPGTPRR